MDLKSVTFSSLKGASPKTALDVLSHDLPHVDVSSIANDVENLARRTVKEQYFGISDLCQNKGLQHPSWNLLAGRILMHEIKTQVPETFSLSTRKLRAISHDDYFNFVMTHHDKLDAMVKEDRDWKYDAFAVQTLLKSYLGRLKKEGEAHLMETPQYMFLRVATFLGYPDLGVIQEIYTDLSLGNYIHASPTLFNSGLYRPQLASCFLMGVEDDMKSITQSWANLAFISKNSGGIGLDITSLRHSEIGQNWFVNKGVIPWVKIVNAILQAIDQGGRRKGSASIYICPWHLDIEEFLDLKKATGPENMRARDLFFALWISDLFMRRVKEDKMWTLFCPNKARGLDSKWGLDFEMTYAQYERKAEAGKLFGFRKIRARELWKKIVLVQIETGMPYVLFKDACNRKSNQQNLGTIRCSNLCAEIVQYSDKDNIASCNLASIALNSCVVAENTANKYNEEFKGKITCSDREKMLLQIKNDLRKETLRKYNLGEQKGRDALFFHPDNIRAVYAEDHKRVPKWWELRYGEWVMGATYFDFSKLERIAAALVRNLNFVIDKNYYPSDVPQIKECNLRNRPMGIGVQGLADTFALLDLAWTSDEAQQLNHDIFETMYYAAIRASVELAKKDGPYETFEGSPTSRGLFQFDLWDLEAYEKKTRKTTFKKPEIDLKVLDFKVKSHDSRYDWGPLREDMMKHGLRNSLLIALMPTASSASILGNNEAFEPFTEMLYSRTVLSGQFTMLNKHMVKDLQKIGLWSHSTYQSLIKNNGSMKGLTTDNPVHSERLAFLKKKYQTAFELPQKVLVQMALDRGRYVCQSQSFNCWMANPTYIKLNAYHFFSWQGGATTGMYYLRQKAKFNPVDFSGSSGKATTCTDEVCISCQS